MDVQRTKTLYTTDDYSDHDWRPIRAYPAWKSGFSFYIQSMLWSDLGGAREYLQRAEEQHFLQYKHSVWGQQVGYNPGLKVATARGFPKRLQNPQTRSRGWVIS